MSSLAYAPDAARRRRGLRELPALFAEHGPDVLLALAMVATLVALLAFLPMAFNVDSWLELVTGQIIWQHGIPWHETLTTLPHGKLWVDQQWLAQLASYGMYRAGGLVLLGTVNVVLIVGGVSGAVIAARRLGASSRAVMLTLPLAAWLLLPSREVRTQAFVIPLFVACVYLLARDARAPSRRVFWTLPMLVLWANLHGSASIGVMLVVARGATVAWERRGALLSRARPWLRPAVLVVGAPLCLLLTPYGLHAIGYYQTMLLGSGLRQTVSEWQPITSVPLMAGAFFVAAGVVVWSFGRNPTRSALWDKLVLIALILGSISVIRNLLFFALAGIVLVPLSLGVSAGRQQPSGRTARLNMTGAAVLLLALVGTVVSTFTLPASKLELTFQRMGVLSTVQRATSGDRSLKVLAEVRFADWLLWRDRSLAGRISNDARFELLTPSQLATLRATYGAIGVNWKQGARGYRLIVADRKYEPQLVAGFMHETGARALYDDGERVVILRSAQGAA